MKYIMIATTDYCHTYNINTTTVIELNLYYEAIKGECVSIEFYIEYANMRKRIAPPFSLL